MGRASYTGLPRATRPTTLTLIIHFHPNPTLTLTLTLTLALTLTLTQAFLVTDGSAEVRATEEAAPG